MSSNQELADKINEKLQEPKGPRYLRLMCIRQVLEKNVVKKHKSLVGMYVNPEPIKYDNYIGFLFKSLYVIIKPIDKYDVGIYVAYKKGFFASCKQTHEHAVWRNRDEEACYMIPSKDLLVPPETEPDESILEKSEPFIRCVDYIVNLLLTKILEEISGE